MLDAAINLLPYQRLAVENPARFTWNCWARQTGKSFTFSLRRVLRGVRLVEGTNCSSVQGCMQA